MAAARARELDEAAADMAGRSIGEVGVEPETEAARDTGWDGGGVGLKEDLVEGGRCGSLGGTGPRFARAFSQSREMRRSVAGLAREEVETCS